ncbi:hypothetical protein, partial [Salmonella sp. SAL4447]|uniref:hypothetical protein n=1 Tax=Salmonella sp. SAL4447 TaxID=3159902 RepID=UPI00397D3283
MAKKQGLATVLEIPLWKIEKMSAQSVETSPPDPGKRATETLLKRVFTVTTQQILEEYELADLLL